LNFTGAKAKPLILVSALLHAAEVDGSIPSCKVQNRFSFVGNKMRLYIPSVGDTIKLTADWEPTIHSEYRNATLFEYFQIPGFNPSTWNNKLPPTKVLISAGEVLKIDRIYIRKGKGDFDSVTFLWKGKKTLAKVETRTGRRIIGQKSPGFINGLISCRQTEYEYEDFTYEDKTPASPVRFWAKLDDVNQIEFEPV
jgi:hypothetical protein